MQPGNIQSKSHFLGDAKTHDLSAEQGSLQTKRKVLLLEDDVEFSELLKSFLESHDFEVTCVTNGAEGMRKIMNTEFNAVLCDLVMPNLPGDMFYLGVERIKPHLSKRFIFMSGHQADPKWGAFIRRIRALMLWKPFELHDLLNALNNVLAKV